MVFSLVCVFTDVYFSSSGEAKNALEKKKPSVFIPLFTTSYIMSRVDNSVNTRQNWQWVEIREL